MSAKRILFSLVCLVMTTVFAHGQVAVKTNVAMDALNIFNAGVEVGLGKKFSLDVPVYYNPTDLVVWKERQNDDSKIYDKLFKVFMVQPELRYWLCDRFNGHFFGIHAMGGTYNTKGIDLPFTPFKDLATHRYEGRFYGGGISYGYQHILSRHWSIEGTVGIGYAYVRYKKHECEVCSTDDVEKGHKNYFGPTRAALNLIYVF